MPSPDTKTPSAIRFNLKSLLALLIGLGVGGGLLGRAFFRSPELFRAAMMTLSTVFPFMLAIVTIIWLGKRHQQKGVVAWAVAIGFMPLLGLGVLMLAQQFYGSSPGGLGVLTNTEIIRQRLPQQIDEPWVWRELDRRLLAGKMNQAEVEAAIDVLAIHLRTKKTSGPLHYTRDFTNNAAQAGLMTEATAIKLCDAFYGSQPKFERLSRIAAGKENLNLSIEYGSPWAQHSGLPLQLVWTVDRIQLNGKPLEMQRPIHSSHSWRGYHEGDFVAGEHQLTAELRCAYVNANDLAGNRSGALERYRWPKTLRKEWQQTVEGTLTVYDPKAQMVKLSTDPKDYPLQTVALSIERLAVISAKATRQGKERCRLVLLMEEADATAAPYSFDVTAKVGDQEIKLGTIFRAGNTSNGNEQKKTIDLIDPEITSADLLFTPNPEAVQHIEGVDRIWGKPIRMPGMRLERFDLEQKK